MHVQVLRPTAVVELHLRPGRGQADVSGCHGVRRTVERQLGRVAVQVQLPQVRQPEHIAQAAHAVDPGADVHHVRRRRQVQDARPHGEKLPPVVNAAHARQRCLNLAWWSSYHCPPRGRLMPHPHRKNLLTSVQMAHFVAHGSFRMDAVVPDEMNAAGDRRTEGRHSRRSVRHPAVGGVHRQRVRPAAGAAARGGRRHPQPRRAGADRRPPRSAHPQGRTRARRRTCTVTRSSTSARTRSTYNSCTTRRT